MQPYKEILSSPKSNLCYHQQCVSFIECTSLPTFIVSNQGSSLKKLSNTLSLSNIFPLGLLQSLIRMKSFHCLFTRRHDFKDFGSRCRKIFCRASSRSNKKSEETISQFMINYVVFLMEMKQRPLSMKYTSLHLILDMLSKYMLNKGISYCAI